MRGLKFLAGLVIVIVLHVVVVRSFGSVSPAFDFFLVLTLFNAVDGNLAAGLVGGLIAGLAADTLMGDLYGLNGFANTVAGYGLALASRRLVIQKAGGVLLAFSLAAAVQQAIILGLRLLLLPEAQLPTPGWVLARIGVVGVLGFVGYMARGHYAQGVAKWRRTRTSRLR